MKYLYALIVFLFAIFLAAFIQQNGQSVALKYFSWQSPPLPLSLYLILMLAAGYLLATLVGLVTNVRHRVRCLTAEREVRRLRAELERVAPAQEEEDGKKDPFPTPTGSDAGAAGGGETRVLSGGEEEKTSF